MNGPGEPASKPPIDFGWLVLGQPDEIDLEAIEEGRERVASALSRAFPELDWRLHLTRRVEPAPALREKPIVLLEHGILERDRRTWDFVLVLTGNEIQGREKSRSTLGVPSQSVDVAAASTVWIDPLANGEHLERGERKEALTRRLVALVHHLFGHLNGLEHDEDPRSWMADIKDVSDLDNMDRWSGGCIEALRETLAQVADPRLEERQERRGPLRFYLGAIWLNASGVANAIGSARPWLFPARLSRFTAAASSALFILLVTAEVWEVGLRQGPALVVAIALAALSAVTLFMLVRQRLLITHGHRGLTEQIAVTNVAVILTVALGLLTTFSALLGLTLSVAWFVVPGDIVAAWSAGDNPPPAARYVVFAGFVASLAILIGALGASFEEQDYLRHVAYVDEET